MRRTPEKSCKDYEPVKHNEKRRNESGKGNRKYAPGWPLPQHSVFHCMVDEGKAMRRRRGNEFSVFLGVWSRRNGRGPTSGAWYLLPTVRSPKLVAARREDLRKAMPKESLAL
jgi:hypothetical protein